MVRVGHILIFLRSFSMGIGNGVGKVYKRPTEHERACECVLYESELETICGFIICVIVGIGTIFLAHFV